MSARTIEHPFTVVVGVDGSPTGQAALRWAIDEARARRGLVRVLHAWSSPYDWQMEVVLPPDEDALRSAAQQRLDDAMSDVDGTGVAVEARLVEGDPRGVLVEAARSADLLVVGSHGHGRVGEVLLGSVSSFCVHHAAVPVVVVRPRQGGI